MSKPGSGTKALGLLQRVLAQYPSPVRVPTGGGGGPGSVEVAALKFALRLYSLHLYRTVREKAATAAFAGAAPKVLVRARQNLQAIRCGMPHAAGIQTCIGELSDLAAVFVPTGRAPTPHLHLYLAVGELLTAFGEVLPGAYPADF